MGDSIHYGLYALLAGEGGAGAPCGAGGGSGGGGVVQVGPGGVVVGVYVAHCGGWLEGAGLGWGWSWAALMGG